MRPGHKKEGRYLDALYARLGGGMKFGLERTEKFMAYLRHPERGFRSIHVAGTNGKGSVVAILAEILQRHGMKVGRFTSPHLVDFRERIRINGEMIPEARIQDFLDDWDDYLKREEISFFEITTGLAFKYFADEEVDIAVVETGLGGRLDSSNVLLPELSLISRIAKDHTRILGGTLKKIALEKAGIIKTGRPLRVMAQSAWVLRHLRQAAEEKGSDFRISDSRRRVSELTYTQDGMALVIRPWEQAFQFPLPGDHQAENLILALEAAEDILSGTIEEAKLRSALLSLQWKGRLEKITHDPAVIFDAGHNLDGFQRILPVVKGMHPSKTLHILLGMLRDKEFPAILELCRQYSENIHLCLVDSHRSFEAGELSRLSGYRSDRIFPGCLAALGRIHPELGKNDLLLVAGSHYIAGDVYEYFQNIGFSG